MTTSTKTIPETYGLVFGENCAAFGIGAAISLLTHDIPIDTVVACGTGVLNAMLLAGGDRSAMTAAWENPAVFRAVFDKAAEMADRFVSDWSGLSAPLREAAAEAALFEPDALTIKANLRRIFDETVIRASDIDVVIMTCPPNSTEAKLIPISAIPEGRLIDAVLRAVTLSPLIPDEHGRYGRRYPEDAGFSYLQEAGVSQVITIGMPGTLPCPRGMRRVVIESSEYLAVAFDPSQADRHREIMLGRLDALQALDLVAGQVYYVDPSGAHEVFDALVDDLDRQPKPFPDGLSRDAGADPMPEVFALLEQTAFRNAPNHMLSLVEITARQSGVPRLALYSPDGLIAATLDTLTEAFDRQGQDLSAYLDSSAERAAIPRFLTAYTLLRKAGQLSAYDTRAITKAMSAEEKLALFLVSNMLDTNGNESNNILNPDNPNP